MRPWWGFTWGWLSQDKWESGTNTSACLQCGACEDVLCIEGLSLSTQTYTHRVFSPPGLWCQCAFTLWEGLWLWIQAGGELALTSSSPNFTKCDSHEEKIWRASKNWGWKVIRGKTLLRRIAWWWIFSGHLLSLFFCPFKYMQTCKWGYGSETGAGKLLPSLIVDRGSRKVLMYVLACLIAVYMF